MTLPEQINKTEKVQVLLLTILEGDTQTYNLAYNKKSLKYFESVKKLILILF